MPLAERNFMSRADTSDQHHADAKLIWDYHQLTVGYTAVVITAVEHGLTCTLNGW